MGRAAMQSDILPAGGAEGVIILHFLLAASCFFLSLS